MIVSYDTILGGGIIRNIVGQSDVDAFLSEVREAIDNGKCIFDDSKKKNRDTLAALALRTEDVYKEIRTLTYEHYIYGPVPDNRPGRKEMVWIFKKKVDWLKIYIKLEFAIIGDRRLMVLSFHEDNII